MRNVHKIPSRKRISIFFLVLILIQSSSILTKAFNCFLLKSYANKKFLPFVESLNDIIDNKKLNVIANQNHLKQIISSNITWTSKFEILLKRIQKSNIYKTESENDFQTNYFSSKNLISMIQGDTVLIGHTVVKEFFMELNDQWKSRFVVSKHKYVSSYSILYVNKTHFLSRYIHYL